MKPGDSHSVWREASATLRDSSSVTSAGLGLLTGLLSLELMNGDSL